MDRRRNLLARWGCDERAASHQSSADLTQSVKIPRKTILLDDRRGIFLEKPDDVAYGLVA